MRTLGLLAGFLVFGLVLFFVFGNLALHEQWREALGPWVWVGVIGLFIADILLPVPNTVLITALATWYGIFWGVVLGWIGLMLAGIVAYAIPWLLGVRFAEWLLGNERERVERFFSDSGMFAVACSRWLPLIHEAVSCFAGMARMRFSSYCLALACGTLPLSLAYASLVFLSDNETIPLVISVILPIPIWFVAGRLLYRKTKSSEADGKPEGP